MKRRAKRRPRRTAMQRPRKRLRKRLVTKRLPRWCSGCPSSWSTTREPGAPARLRCLVDEVATAERALRPPGAPLSLAATVARNYAKLLMFKDEYEVARWFRRRDSGANSKRSSRETTP